MGINYSYKCTKATVLDDMGITHDGNQIVFTRLAFENEHGHKMETIESIVVLRKYGAKIVTEIEDILDAEISDDEWERQSKRYEKLIRNDIGFGIYNDEEIAETIRLQLAAKCC